MILSASRRTDIPCYYSEWFMKRLEEGYVLTRNPMNYSQISRIKLSPDTIDCIVFWSKDPLNMMDKLDQIDALGYRYYFHFTITPYQLDIEKNLRPKEDIVTTFKQLSERIGKEKVLWRYDPIIINKEMGLEYHIVEFEHLCRELCGYTELCNISFVDRYQKLNKSVKENVLPEISQGQMIELASKLAKIAKQYHIQVRACCEEVDLSNTGVEPASCIDARVIEGLIQHPIKVKSDKHQRPGCNCIQSVDIGVYNTCKNGCVYCYANHSDASVQNNFLKHDKNAEILIGKVELGERITERKK